MRFRLLLAISLILVCATMATSHHSFAGVYDESRLVTVSGVVTQFKFVNPHALMSLDVTDPSGKVAKWTIEFSRVADGVEMGAKEKDFRFSILNFRFGRRRGIVAD